MARALILIKLRILKFKVGVMAIGPRNRGHADALASPPHGHLNLSSLIFSL